jgi:hypothetical protein
MESSAKVLEAVMIDGKLYIPVTVEELNLINTQLQKFSERRRKSRESMTKLRQLKKEEEKDKEEKPKVSKKYKTVFSIKTPDSSN